MIAHEIGHALGMKHDFLQRRRIINGNNIRTDSLGNRCTLGNGVMGGNTSQVDRFSTCSKEDFKGWYNKVVDKHGYFSLTCGK